MSTGRGPIGNVTAVKEVDESAGNTTITQQCFEQDYLRRLTEAWTTTANACQADPTQAAVGGPDSYWQSFTYDVTGNRTTDTVHTPNGDTVRDYITPTAGGTQPHALTRRETRGGGPTTSYTYDPAGNLKTRTAASGTDTLTWDAEGLRRQQSDQVLRPRRPDPRPVRRRRRRRRPRERRGPGRAVARGDVPPTTPAGLAALRRARRELRDRSDGASLMARVAAYGEPVMWEADPQFAKQARADSGKLAPMPKLIRDPHTPHHPRR